MRYDHLGDWCEVLRGIVRQLIQARVDRQGSCAEQNRIPIWWGSGGNFRADDSVGTDSIIDNHGLAEPVSYLGTDDSSNHIRGRARYVGDDAADWAVGVVLRAGILHKHARSPHHCE